MGYIKKLIEAALPLAAINAESSREKSIRHGHPSTLHLWWARRPLAAARAVIWSSLVDDPSSHPEEFPTEEAQAKERARLFGILERLVKWENSNDQEILAEAKREIMKSTGGSPPALLDPFAGGGAIPLEAQRLGLSAYACDLNPVAVMINKAMIEIPPKFAGKPPVNPESKRLIDDAWTGAAGLAEDVRYYGMWMKKKAFERIGHLYPSIKDGYGQERTVIAWIWARTVKCPNPLCGAVMPLAGSFELSKKKGREAFVQPVVEHGRIRYEVRYGQGAPEPPKTARGKFKCVCCGEPVQSAYIKGEGKAKRIGAALLAVVAETSGGRLYLSPDEEHIKAAEECGEPPWKPEGEMNQDCTDIVSGRGYGFTHWHELFTNRQLIALTAFSDLVSQAQEQIMADGGSEEYAKAVAVYLAFAVDKGVNYWSSCCAWHTSAEKMMSTFARQAIPMVWDYTEANPFSNSSGNWLLGISQAAEMCERLGVGTAGIVSQQDCQTDNGLRNTMVSTDPPYYDNIGYADLSDYFYIWLRVTLKKIYPDLFRTLLVPKAEELVATPYRFEGGRREARDFFEKGMLQAFKQIYIYAGEDAPVTIFYAYRQSEGDGGTDTASTGWETMLAAIIQSGFAITGTWPMRTELTTALKGNINALASSIVLVCRKRAADAPICTRRDFINALKRELKPALASLQAGNIAPVDLAQCAIGPGMGVYSRFSKVLEADGRAMNIRSALHAINQELDSYFTQQDGELDGDTRFCLDLYTQSAFNSIKFGDADVLARAKNTSVEKLASRGALYAQKGVVRLRGRDEIPEKAPADQSPFIWLLAQRLTRALEKGGAEAAAKIAAGSAYEAERAKALAYRLFTISERKGWTAEAFAYNSLVISWQDVQSWAARLESQRRDGVQLTLDDFKEE
jgi:putative DNA methylase